MNTPAILSIPLKELVIDETLSGRTRKEISDNAKALAPKMEAFSEWDATQPGAIFKRDGKNHLARGFTRVAASEIAGIKTGWFMEVPDDIASLRTEAIRSNTGKPITAREQGRIYAAMRDGNAETAKKGDVILAPMKLQEISDAIGYSVQWIAACIGIYEETPEIAALIEADEVTSGAITRARQIAKNEDKTPDDAGRLKLLKAAIKNAKDDGRPRAAEDDVNAVRHDLFPIKADAPKKGKPKKESPLKGTKVAHSNEGAVGGDNGGDSNGKTEELFGVDLSKSVEPSKKTVNQAKEIAGAIFEQCFADKTLADFDAFLVSLNNAGVQLSLSAL